MKPVELLTQEGGLTWEEAMEILTTPKIAGPQNGRLHTRRQENLCRALRRIGERFEELRLVDAGRAA